MTIKKAILSVVAGVFAVILAIKFVPSIIRYLRAEFM